MSPWIVVTIVVLVVLLIAWWDWRGWYRLFQQRFQVKLPFICTVTYSKEKDKVIWGNRRYRFITKEGRKDHRHALNVKWTYPTTLVLQRYKVKIWNIDEARRVFHVVSPYLDIPLRCFTFEGKVDGDLLKYFNGSTVLFVRYCLKLLEFYGWTVELSGYTGCNGIAKNGTHMYAIHCVLRETPMVLNDLVRLPPVAPGLQWIVIGNGKVSSGAREYAKEHKILLMDRECIRRTFVYEEPQFL